MEMVKGIYSFVREFISENQEGMLHLSKLLLLKSLESDLRVRILMITFCNQDHDQFKQNKLVSLFLLTNNSGVSIRLNRA